MDFIIKHDLTNINFEEVCQVIHKAGLSTHAVEFCKRLGYSKMLTGMARFKNQALMREKKFIE